MNQRKEELLKQIEDLEKQIEPLKQELTSIYQLEYSLTDSRITKAENGHGDFKLDELVFAAYARCECGAGLCYPKHISINGSWYCSKVLMGNFGNTVIHTSPLPFAFYSVKSENQPSANGATTRPSNE